MSALVSLSENLNPFQRRRGGTHKLCTYGAGMAKSTQVGWHPVIRKDHRLIGIHFFLARARKKTDTEFIAGLPRARSARGTEPHTHRLWSTSFPLVVT